MNPSSLPSSLRLRFVVVCITAIGLIGLTASPGSAAPPAVAWCYVGAVVGVDGNGNPQTDYAISWSPVAAVDGAGNNSGYVIRRQLDGTTNWSWRNRASSGTSAWFDNKPGSAGTTPSTYRITTKDGAGAFGPHTICTPMGEPQSITVDSVSPNPGGNGSDISMSWSSTQGATGYRIYRTDAGGTTTMVDSTASTSFTDSAVTDGSFTWSVSAIISATDNTNVSRTWESARSDDSTIVVLQNDTERPATPRKPALVSLDDGPGNDSTVSLDLIHDGDNVGVNRFVLYRNTSDDFPGATATIINNPNDLTTVRHSESVAPGTYYYWLKVYDAADNLSYRSGFLQVTIDQPVTTSELSTQSVNGRWEIVDSNGAVVRWEAVNVRTDEIRANSDGTGSVQKPITQAHIDDLTTRFNAIRLSMHWDQIEPQNNQPNTLLVGDICGILNAAHGATRSDNGQAKPVQVILDIAHFGGDNGWLPDFAWSNALPGVAKNKPNSFPVWQGADFLDYIDYIMAEATCAGPNGSTTLGQHPAVVAIEPMNEPHPLKTFQENGRTVTTGGGWTDYAQAVHVELYDDVVKRIRRPANGRPNVPVVLGAFYGGHLYDNSASLTNQNWLAALSTPNFTATAKASGDGTYPPAADRSVSLPMAHDNLIWTAHNYYTGVGSDGSCTSDGACLAEREGPDYDQNGLPDPDGMKNRGVRAGGLWTESYNSKGCYGWPKAGLLNCTEPAPESRRNVARTGHRANAWNHDRISQAADMPFFMGEWGVSRYRAERGFGWKNATQMVCDKLMAYRSVRSEADAGQAGVSISWAAWAFDTRVDGGFGLYNPNTRQWSSHAAPFTYTSCTG